MTRNTWRNIFIGIIILTIPCYIFGIGVALYNNVGSSPTATPADIATRTPIDPTVLALTDPSLIVTDIPLTVTSSPTPLDLGFTPIVPTFSSGFTAVPFETATPVPTRYLSPTPTTPAPITNTPVPTNTLPPTATQPILVPPTNTPSP